MYRALRTFALAGLLAFAVFVAFVYASYVGVFPPFVSPVPELLKNAFGTTGFALTFTSGVVAVVVCLQRRRYRWAAGLIALLVLATYGLYFAAFLYQAITWLHVGASPFLTLLEGPPVAQYIPAMLLAVLVLIYSFRRPRAAEAAGVTASASTSRHAHGP
jgi:hypothetical protein